MADRLIDRLSAYADTATPMHMPGHKRNTQLADYLAQLGAHLDITEIDGFDNLHDAQGILRDAMQGAARLWGSRRAFFLVNGSTCGNLAAVRAVLGGGGRAVVARNCHRSVYNALELCRVEPHFIWPARERLTGTCGGIRPQDAADALDACPDARLLIVTSPTYEGVVSDLAGICRQAHLRGVPVLVDEAHGAHLGFGHGFPDGAVHAGADLVVHSLHKTLPSLTQTALLHVSGGLVDPQRVADALAVFETSSPSYLLLASIDACVHLLAGQGDLLLDQWQQRLIRFGTRMAALSRLTLLDTAPDAAAMDPSKLVLCTAQAGISGPALSARLREGYAIECEAATARSVLAMTGMGDTDAALSRLADALQDIDTQLSCTHPSPLPEPERPETVLPVWQAADIPRTPVPPEQAAGHVCAEYVWLYPPGIPLYLPGERIGPDFAALAAHCAADGLVLHGSAGTLPEKICVLCRSED